MAAADVQAPPTEPAPGVPDYLASPNATLNDTHAQWRYGQPPDYSKTRKVWEETKHSSHEAGSLPQLVENLVKNWEVEASFKPRLEDWRTVDHDNYTFAINGGPPQSAQHMLKVGTYNAIIAPNEYYSPEHSDFASSHKTFKRMMPTFAWEVVEVYSGPPTVSFKWRHWGTFKNDYVGFNDKGEKITVKATGGPINIYGVTVAQVDDKVRLQKVDTWFDPLDMFRQMAPNGIVNKEIVDAKITDRSAALDMPSMPVNDGIRIAQQHNGPNAAHSHDAAPKDVMQTHMSSSTGQAADAFVPHQGAKTDGHAVSAKESATSKTDAQAVVETAAVQGASMKLESPESNFNEAASDRPSGSTEGSVKASDSQYSSAVTGKVENGLKVAQTGSHVDESVASDARDAVDEHLEKPAAEVHPHPKDMEAAVKPEAGEAVAAPAESEETRRTYEEMSRITPTECPFLMNRE